MKNYTNQNLNNISIRTDLAIKYIKDQYDLNFDYSITSLLRQNDSGSHGKNKAVDIVIEPEKLMPLVAMYLHDIFKDTANIYLKDSPEALHIHIDSDFTKGSRGKFGFEQQDKKTILFKTDLKTLFSYYGLYPEDPIYKKTYKEFTRKRYYYLIPVFSLLIIAIIIKKITH